MYVTIYQSKRANVLFQTESWNIQNFKFLCLTQHFPRGIWKVNLQTNRDARLRGTWSNRRFPINHEATKNTQHWGHRNFPSDILRVDELRSPFTALRCISHQLFNFHQSAQSAGSCLSLPTVVSTERRVGWGGRNMAECVGRETCRWEKYGRDQLHGLCTVRIVT
jgi:hypothetical protein